MSGEKLVVIGGDAAGMSAASKAKRDNPDMDVIVFESKDIVSFGLCGLPHYVSGEVEELDDLLMIPKEVFRKKRNIDVRTNHCVIDISPDEKTVIAVDDVGNEVKQDYDKLVIAMGGHAEVSDISGADLKNVFTLHWLEDGRKIRKFIEDKDPKRVVVTGGYIDMELMEAFLKSSMEVTVVAKYDHILPEYSSEIVEPISEGLKSRGVNIERNSMIVEMRGNEQGEVNSVVTNKGKVDVDFVLLNTGMQPTVEIADEAGIETGPTGGIVVNDRLETNIRGIYAAGDCVETENMVSGEKVYTPLGDVANRQGRIAGINAAGGNATFPGVLGTQVTKILDYGIARTGLNEEEAMKAGFDAKSVFITTHSRAAYYPDGSEIGIEVVFDKRTGRLLGAQMVGKEGIAQRINVFASLIYNENTVQEIQNIDFGYAPPFSPAWDPVQTAAKVAAGKLEGSK